MTMNQYPKPASITIPVDLTMEWPKNMNPLVTQADFDSHVLNTVQTVKKYGAKGDGVKDDGEAIQTAIDDLSSMGGGELYFPAGTYLTGQTLNIPSNIIIRGAGAGSTLIRDSDSLGAKPIFLVQGTEDNPVINVGFTNIAVRNGSASNHYTTGKDGIVCRYVNNIYFYRCKITEIQGVAGIYAKFTKNIQVRHCHFYRWTYSGLSLLVECEEILVSENIFDTATETVSDSYTIATGGDIPGEGNFFVKNLVIEKNKFLNNPRWEGIDCHGGENIWIRDNYIENCKIGIMCGIDHRGFVSSPVLKNVHVTGNRIIQGMGENGGSGIIICGTLSKNNAYVLYGENIFIENNSLNGFGPPEGILDLGSITLYTLNNFTVCNNVIDNFYQGAITLYHTCLNGSIRGNIIKNCRGKADLSTSWGIMLRTYGISDIDITNNYLRPNMDSGVVDYFIRDTSDFLGRVQVSNNSIDLVNTSFTNSVKLPVEHATIPSTLTQRYQDIIYDNTGKPRWYVSNPKTGIGSQRNVIILKGDIEAGSNIMNNLIPEGIFQVLDIVPGANVVITGAGTGGADLITTVIKNTKENLILMDNAESTVNQTNVSYQGLTLEEL